MKKTLTIIIIAVIGITALYTAYMIGYKQRGSIKNINIVNTQTEKRCITNQDCVNNGVVCDQPGDQPICAEASLATGEKYPEPKCVCLNLNKEY